jgi:O-antigen/teichoic acid export membrane protein
MATDVLGNLLLLFFGWSLLAKKAFTGWWYAKCEEWQKVFKFTWWTNITSTFDLPIKQFDIMIVAAVVSLEAVGLYKIFKQVTLILIQVADPIYQVVYPQFSTFLAQGKTRKAVRLAVKTGVILLLFSLPMAFVISLLSPWWMSSIFGEAYTKDLLALGVYLFLIAISIGFISIHPLFIAMGFVKYNVAILAVSNTLYVLAAWFLGGIFGLMGIVIAYGIQFSSILISKYCLLSDAYRKIR